MEKEAEHKEHKRFVRGLTSAIKFCQSANIPREELFRLIVKAQFVESGVLKWETNESSEDINLPKILWNESYGHLKNFLNNLSEQEIIEDVKKKRDVLQNFKPKGEEGQDVYINLLHFKRIKCKHLSKLMLILKFLIEDKEIIKPNLDLLLLMRIHFSDKNGQVLKKKTLIDLKARHKNSNLEMEIKENINEWLKMND